MGKDINVSIVLYNSEFNSINNLVVQLRSCSLVNDIFLIDNSAVISHEFEYCDAKYVFSGNNLGYGGGHNMAIEKSLKSVVKYHLVINSDIAFEYDVLEIMFEKLESDNSIGMCMPKVLNTDGTVQLLPKLLPTPFSLLLRVFSPFKYVFKTAYKNYLLSDFWNIELNAPILSGCFSLFRVEVLREIGVYDDSFFMYFEDFDISRRIHTKYKTLYFPTVKILHEHERGATKSLKLFRVFIHSAFVYFNKYGWFFDRERVSINKAVLKSLK